MDRLRKSRAEEIIIVVPKRALLIQSIVNLKLLKKEADALKRQIMIVTQDKLGKLLIEKTGILVQQKLDDVEGEELEGASSRNESAASASEVAKPHKSDVIDLKKRLESIGSEEYFETSEGKNKEYSLPKEEPKASPVEKVTVPEEKILNKELVTEAGIDITRIKNAPPQEIDAASSMVKNLSIHESQNAYYDTSAKSASLASARKIDTKKSLFKKENLPEPSERGIEAESFGGAKIENFFQHKSSGSRDEKKAEYKNVNLSGKVWKLSLMFGFIALIIMCVALAYLFVPKAKVMVFAKSKIKSVDTQVQASIEVEEIDLDKQRVPSDLVTMEEEVSRTYSSTGTKSASNQKAKGIITIYNEYSAVPQPLVATTRFLSEEGKLFRLVKSVTIPGMTRVGEEMKSGVIEAEVTADEAGESFNIGPSKFTIPGFENSGADKYAKFYAKSSKPIGGGGNGSGTVKVVSSGDINTAKSKLLAELNEIIKKKVKDSAGEDMLVLDEALDMNESTYTLSSSEGEAADSFTISVKTKAKALLFSQNDLKEVLGSLVMKAGDGKTQTNKLSLALEFGKADADFSRGSLTVRVSAKGKIIPNVDKDNLKRGILGKSEEALKAYLGTYPDITKVEVDYWPSFVSGKIPSYESRVEVEILDSETRS